MRIFAFALSVLVSIQLFSQTSGGKEMDIEAHKPIGYLGASVSQPMFIGKSSQPLGYWQGLSLKTGMMFFQGQWGRTIDENLDSNSYIGRGFIFSWGIRFSKPTTKPGRMAFGTFAVKPKIDAGITFAHIPHDTVIKGFNYPMSLGMHLSPGIIFRASSIYVIAACDVDIMGSIEPMFKPGERHFNLGRGIVISPTLTIGFDNGWEILAPQTRKGEGTYKYTEFHYTGESWTTSYDVSQNAYVETHTIRGVEVEKEGAYSYHLRRIDAFMGIGPALQFYSNSNAGQTQMYGAVIGLKAGFLKVDAQYLIGTRGLGNGIREAYVQQAVYDGKHINYTSSVKGTEMSVKAGFNLAHIFYPKSLFRSHDSRVRILGTTFFGVCVYYKYGQMTFNGVPNYTFHGAEESLDALFASGLAEKSSSTDARMLPASSMMQGVGVSMDFGMVSIGLEKMKFKDAPIADGFQGSIALVLPIRRAIRMGRLRAIDRKKSKEK